MHETDRIGIVTVTYNSSSVIQPFMDSLLKQSYANFLFYAVDNASSDTTLQLLAEYRDSRLTVVANQGNVGVAEGNNIGIRAALEDGCRFVLLINNDTVFDSDLISKLLDGFREYQCDMITPKILYFDPPDRIWCAGGAFTRWRASARHFGYGRKDNGRFNQARQVDYSPTCCMLIKKEVFERIGLMDAKYFVYFDDTDFCLRARQAGMRLLYFPEVRLYHKISSLTGQGSAFAIRYLTRNHVYYSLKHFGTFMGFYYLAICQAHLVKRCLFAREKIRMLSLAEKAFWEGVLLFYSSPHSTQVTEEPSYSHGTRRAL
jgi:GT2 family glycosyltransferase